MQCCSNLAVPIGVFQHTSGDALQGAHLLLWDQYLYKGVSGMWGDQIELPTLILIHNT